MFRRQVCKHKDFAQRERRCFLAALFLCHWLDMDRRTWPLSVRPFAKSSVFLSVPASACRVETEKISVLPAARDAVIWAVFLPELSFLKLFRRVETDTVRVPPTFFAGLCSCICHNQESRTILRCCCRVSAINKSVCVRSEERR